MKISKKDAARMGICDEPRSPADVVHKKVGQHNGRIDRNQGRNILFDKMCKANGIKNLPVHEYQFHATRKWRFDYLFDGWLALEVQGGLFIQGRHVNGAALVGEHEKLNEAVILGYAVMFCTPDQIADGSIFPLIKRALAAEEEQG